MLRAAATRWRVRCGDARHIVVGKLLDTYHMHLHKHHHHFCTPTIWKVATSRVRCATDLMTGSSRLCETSARLVRLAPSDHGSTWRLRRSMPENCTSCTSSRLKPCLIYPHDRDRAVSALRMMVIDDLRTICDVFALTHFCALAQTQDDVPRHYGGSKYG